MGGRENGGWMNGDQRGSQGSAASAPPGPPNPPKCQWCGDQRCGWVFVCTDRQAAQARADLLVQGTDRLIAQGATEERSSLREKVEAMRAAGVANSPGPLYSGGFAAALEAVLSLLDEAARA